MRPPWIPGRGTLNSMLCRIKSPKNKKKEVIFSTVRFPRSWTRICLLTNSHRPR